MDHPWHEVQFCYQMALQENMTNLHNTAHTVSGRHGWLLPAGSLRLLQCCSYHTRVDKKTHAATVAPGACAASSAHNTTGYISSTMIEIVCS